MPSFATKTVLAFATVTTLYVSLPREADACIFRWWHERRAARVAARTAYYAPTACGTCQPVCNTCQPPPQQVCSYQPQTCYRTVMQQVPVTVYRPVTTVDPCTGCPTTTMQACTTMTTQAQRVPVTTFRQVCQTVQPVQPACNTCAMPVVAAMPPPPMMQQQQFVQQAMPVAPATPGCSSCGGGGQAFAAPAQPMYQQQFQQPPQAYQQAPQQYQPTTELAPQQPSSSLQPVPADQTPTLQQGGQSYYQGPTFPSNNGTSPSPSTGQYPSTSSYPPVTSVPSTSSNLYPVPSTTATPSTGTSYQPRVPASSPPAIRPLPDLDRVEPAAPALLNPQDRTAARELPQPGAIAPISWASAKVAAVEPAFAAQPVGPAVKKWDSSGWVPAR